MTSCRFRLATDYARARMAIHNLTTGRDIAGFESYFVRGNVKWDPHTGLPAVLTLARPMS